MEADFSFLTSIQLQTSQVIMIVRRNVPFSPEHEEDEDEEEEKLMRQKKHHLLLCIKNVDIFKCFLSKCPAVLVIIGKHIDYDD